MRLIRRWYNILTSHQGLLIQFSRIRFGAGPRLSARLVSSSAASASCDTSIRNNSIADETCGLLLSLHELGIQGNGDVVTHQNSAGLEGSVPRQTEVLAIDLGTR